MPSGQLIWLCYFLVSETSLQGFLWPQVLKSNSGTWGRFYKVDLNVSNSLDYANLTILMERLFVFQPRCSTAKSEALTSSITEGLIAAYWSDCSKASCKMDNWMKWYNQRYNDQAPNTVTLMTFWWVVKTMSQVQAICMSENCACV